MIKSEQIFFIIVSPGLEEIAQKELEEKWSIYFSSPFPSLERLPGGLLISCLKSEGLLLNHLLRIPTRILMRIKEQKCRDLPKLYHILKKIPWKTWLRNERVTLTLSSHESRLFQSNKIEKSAQKALKDYFQANAIKKSERLEIQTPQTLFLRFDHDLLTISLDTTGERLDQRRAKNRFKGKASIRENLATSLLYKMLSENISRKENITLLDPMCGSGTFLLEARDFSSPITTRSFSFQNWKNCQPFQFKSTPKKWDFSQFIGFDRDEQIIQKLITLYPDFVFRKKDLFENNPIKEEYKDLVIITNPPYGKRIAIERDKKLYFQKIVDKLEKKYSPLHLGVITPRGITLSSSRQDKKLQHFYLNNSGFKITFWFY